MSIKFNMAVDVAIRYDEETQSYVSYAPAFNLYSGAMTKAQAKKAIKSALKMYLAVCIEKGILSDVLRTAGYTKIAENVDPQREKREVAKMLKSRHTGYESIGRVPTSLHLAWANA